MKSKLKDELSEASQIVVNLMAVDGVELDEDDLKRLQRIDNKEITIDDALDEIRAIAREFSKKDK